MSPSILQSCLVLQWNLDAGCYAKLKIARPTKIILKTNVVNQELETISLFVIFFTQQNIPLTLLSAPNKETLKNVPFHLTTKN
jgi:hypothetical protein